MTPDPYPTNVVPVHDLLTEALATARDTGADFGYGVALFPRRGRFDAPVFGLVTRGGESTTLTYRMLQDLTDQPLWLSGRVCAVLREARTFGAPRTAPTGLMDQPVLHLAITCWVGPDLCDRERTAALDSTIYAGDLSAPLILLMYSRPAGWPA